MVHHRAVGLIALLFVLAAQTAKAAETGPATKWTGSAPSGACKGSRVTLRDTAGTIYCCVTGTWTACGSAGGGAPTTSKYLLQQADASLPAAQAMGALGTGLVLNATTTGVQSIYGGADAGAGNAIRALTASGGVATSIAVPTIANTSNGLKGNGSGGAVAATAGTDYSAGTAGLGTGLLKSTTGTGALSIAIAGDLPGGPYLTTAAPTGATYITQTADGTLSAEQALSSLSSGFVKVTTGTGVLSSTASIDLSSDTAATVLPMSKGGTGANLTGTTGGVYYSSSSTVTTQTAGGAIGTVLYNSSANTPAWLATGAANLFLMANGAAAPTWAAAPRTYSLAANYTNSSTTPSTILSWPIAVSQVMHFKCMLAVTNTATSVIRYSANGPASPTAVVTQFRLHSTSQVTEATAQVFTALGPAAQTTALTTGVATTIHLDFIEGVIANGASSGTITILGSASTAGQTSTITAGSGCEVI